MGLALGVYNKLSRFSAQQSGPSGRERLCTFVAIALQLLATLASSSHCAQQLCDPTLFSSLLTIARIQAEQRDFAGAERALTIIDALILNEGGSIDASQRLAAQKLAHALLDAVDDEPLRASAQHTLDVATHGRNGDDLFGDVADLARRSLSIIGESLGSLFVTPAPRRRRAPPTSLSSASAPSLSTAGHFS
eukprot:6180633-Pleurochrysis_carterae.AAC.6